MWESYIAMKRPQKSRGNRTHKEHFGSEGACKGWAIIAQVENSQNSQHSELFQYDKTKASCTPAFLDQVWQFLPLLQTSGLKIVVVLRAFSLGRCNKPQDEQGTVKGILIPYLILTNACVTLLAASFHWPALVESLRTVEGKNKDLSRSWHKTQTEPEPFSCCKTVIK